MHRGSCTSCICVWSRELIIDPVLTYGTYVGGSDEDYVGGIAVDGAGNLIVGGYTYSLDFPVSEDTFQTERAPPDPDQTNTFDSFGLKLSAD